MPISLDEVLTLAKGTHVLTEEQMVRILKAAPKMTPADLEKLKIALLQIREKETERMKKKIEMNHKVGTAQHEWKADKARTQLNSAEAASKDEESAALSTLLTKL